MGQRLGDGAPGTYDALMERDAAMGVDGPGPAEDAAPGEDKFPAEDEPTRLIGSRDVVPYSANAAQISAAPPGDEPTRELTPEALARLRAAPPPQAARPRRSGARRPPRWLYALTTLLIVAVIAGVAYAVTRSPTSGGPGAISDFSSCAAGSPCQVANSYLADYTGAKYEAMYGLTSSASRTRFSDPAILNAAAKYAVNAVTYTSAHDYIVTRTGGIIAQAQIYSMSATTSPVVKVSATQATVAARVVMSSRAVGDFTLDVTLPLRLENRAWRVDWSPGLILPQLDDQSDPNYTRVVRLTTTTAARGTIYDAAGDVLAVDETDYVVGVTPAHVTNQAAVTQALTSNLDLTPAEITQATAGADPNSFAPVRTITPMLYDQVKGALTLPGIEAHQSTGRVYPYGVTTAPVTGFIGQVTQQDLAHDTTRYYQSGDIIGRAGVEQWGERYLRPVKGGELDIRARNADGTDGPVIVTVAQRAAVNGESIYTTINLPAQKGAMDGLYKQGGHSGGAVALDPTTGDVLAMGSYPIYDPNDFSLGFTANEQARFNALPSPYVNRATMAADPVGSVFKLVTLSAALEHGISPTQVFTCTGTFQVPGENHLRYDDAPNGHGSLTAPKAIAPSCDVVYWTVAVDLNQQDPNVLPATAKQFGFGSPTGMIGLPAAEDAAGLAPDPAWLKQHKNALWTPTDAANLGIGQGFFEASPAQVAELSATIANNGTRMQPRLVTHIVGPEGQTVQSIATHAVGTAPLSATNLQIVQVAMLGPIYDSNGTTAPDFVNYPITVAGKTGTAESGQQQPHSWFTCYAPATKVSGPPVTPRIAIGSLVEYSGAGEHFAVPVSKSIMAGFFNLSQ